MFQNCYTFFKKKQIVIIFSVPEKSSEVYLVSVYLSQAPFPQDPNRDISWSFITVIHGQDSWIGDFFKPKPSRTGGNWTNTLPETSIAPENGWLEYYFPIGMAHCQGLLMLVSGRVFYKIMSFQSLTWMIICWLRDTKQPCWWFGPCFQQILHQVETDALGRAIGETYGQPFATKASSPTGTVHIVIDTSRQVIVNHASRGLLQELAIGRCEGIFGYNWKIHNLFTTWMFKGQRSFT